MGASKLGWQFLIVVLLEQSSKFHSVQAGTNEIFHTSYKTGIPSFHFGSNFTVFRCILVI